MTSNNNGSWNGVCRLCGNPNAYIGYNDIECPNQNCQNYTEKQHKIVEQEMEAQEEAERAHSQENHDADLSGYETDCHDDPTQGLWAAWGQVFPGSSPPTIPPTKMTKGPLVAPPSPAGPAKRDVQQDKTDDDADDAVLTNSIYADYLNDISFD